jgi:hypothetical protein
MYYHEKSALNRNISIGLRFAVPVTRCRQRWFAGTSASSGPAPSAPAPAAAHRGGTRQAIRQVRWQAWKET